MPKPSGGRLTVKGTRGNDDIAVVANGVMVNGQLRPINQADIDAGLTIKGDAGDDRILGGAGADTVDGGAGNDELRGGDGADKLVGGAGDDTLVDDLLTTTFNGGRGVDTLDFTGLTTAVAIDLQFTGAIFVNGFVYEDSGYLAFDMGSLIQDNTIIDVENLIGGLGNDYLQGSNEANVLRGGGGNDMVNAMTTNDDDVDLLFGDDGNDRLLAGNGNDEMTGGAGVDMFTIESMNQNGDWIIHDYEAGEKVVLFQPTEELSWSASTDPNNPWVMASLADGDSLTFMGLTSWDSIDITQTTVVI